MSTVVGTVDLTKDYDHSITDVFSAWSSEAAQRSWGDPGEGWEMNFDQFRFAVGKTDVCRFGPKGRPTYINENHYLQIEPEQRIVYATSLKSGNRLTFAGTVAITFGAIKDGTRMRLIEQGLYFDGQDEVTGHQSGWEGMLSALGLSLRGSLRGL